MQAAVNFVNRLEDTQLAKKAAPPRLEETARVMTSVGSHD
jgi:hypothetical protein